MYYKTITTPIGDVTLTSDGEALTGIYHTETEVLALFPAIQPTPHHMIFQQTEQWLASYFAGENPACTLPIRAEGTAFQQEVWEILRTIPYGSTTTYGAIAQQIATKRGKQHFSAQAVGGAVGKNPLSIYIPCHRVLGAKHQLTGYHGGLERKQKLLQLEGIAYQTSVKGE